MNINNQKIFLLALRARNLLPQSTTPSAAPATRLGGLGLHNPATYCELEYPASKLISKPIVKLIMNQQVECPHDCLADQMVSRSTVQKQRRQQAAEQLKPTFSNTRRRAMEFACERGALNWLTSLPTEAFGFSLHTGA